MKLIGYVEDSIENHLSMIEDVMDKSSADAFPVKYT